jgi:alpha-glucosidase
MTEHAWWRGAVIYQIYPRSFSDSDGDGIGDLPGITAHLDHVARLGVDAIWLCPFYVSPMRDFGYDVANYTAVDPLFGTLADFDALLARAHALGLRVLIDQVWSHTSDEHPWFVRSRASAGNEKAGWYIWADPKPDGTPPNNWLSVFGGSAWSWEPRRRQYYLHHFLPYQPQLNLDNPEVQDALLASGRFWLDRGVDGFRLDALDFMTHDPLLRDNPVASRTGPVPVKLFGMQHHLHDMMQPQTLDFLSRIRALLARYPGAAALGEVSSQEGAFHRIHQYTLGTAHLQMAYTLRPLRSAFDWATLHSLLVEAAILDHDGWLCWSFSNHDVERAITRWNPDPGSPPDPRFARLLLALQLSLRGSVCIYQGEELGLPEAELRREDLRDPFGITYWPEFRGRDGSRAPMPWEGTKLHAGFTTGKPWLPVPESYQALAVDVQEADAGAVLHAWRYFLAFRRAHPALVHGALRLLDLPEPCLGFIREEAPDRVLCLFNLAGTEIRVDRSQLQAQAFGGGALPDKVPAALEPFGTCFVCYQ